MGRVEQSIPMLDIAGGLDEFSSFSTEKTTECILADNIYFERYGKTGYPRKRKGYTVLNASALDGSILVQYRYTLNGINYLLAFTSNGTLYKINTSTWAGTSVLTGMDVTTLPTFSVLNNVVYAHFGSSITQVSNCDSTTGWTGVGTGTGTLSVSSVVKYEGLASLKVPVVAVGAGLNGAEFTYAANLTGRTVELAFGLAKSLATVSRARASNVATIVTAAHGLTTGNMVYVTGLGGTGYNSTSAVQVTVVNTTTFTYPNSGADETTTADTAGTVTLLSKVPNVTKYRLSLYTNADYTYWEGTKTAAGDPFPALPIWGKIILPVDLATKTGNGGVDCTLSNITKIRLEFNIGAAGNYDLYIDSVKTYLTAGGIYYSLTDSSWTKNSNPFSPRGKYLVLYDNRIHIIDDGYDRWSNLNDGTDWYPYSATYDRDGDGQIDTGKTASSSTIDAGEPTYGAAVIGDQLIIQKAHGIIRVNLSGATTYTFTPQLSGKQNEGVGGISHYAIQNCVLENLYSDVYGKAEYLVYPSDKGIHAMGITGNPLDIHQRVNTTYSGFSIADWKNAFSVLDPRLQLYILFPGSQGQQYSTKQLVFSLRSKAWSTYTFTNRITSALQYTSDNESFVILGDTNGYLYKHNYASEYNVSEMHDNGVAYNAALQLNYRNINADFDSILSSVTLRRQNADLDINYDATTLRIVGDSGNVVTGERVTTLSQVGELINPFTESASEVQIFNYSNRIFVGGCYNSELIIKELVGATWCEISRVAITATSNGYYNYHFFVSKAGKYYVIKNGGLYLLVNGTWIKQKRDNGVNDMSIGMDATGSMVGRNHMYQTTYASKNYLVITTYNFFGGSLVDVYRVRLNDTTDELYAGTNYLYLGYMSALGFAFEPQGWIEIYKHPTVAERFYAMFRDESAGRIKIYQLDYDLSKTVAGTGMTATLLHTFLPTYYSGPLNYSNLFYDGTNLYANTQFYSVKEIFRDGVKVAETGVDAGKNIGFVKIGTTLYYLTTKYVGGVYPYQTKFQLYTVGTSSITKIREVDVNWYRDYYNPTSCQLADGRYFIATRVYYNAGTDPTPENGVKLILLVRSEYVEPLMTGFMDVDYITRMKSNVFSVIVNNAGLYQGMTIYGLFMHAKATENKKGA
jgi:hypothetical protein